jgi:ADP-ribosyl-[dinitrogen reductase] hydrolase
MTARTSLTHALRIDEVKCAPDATGCVGITFCPGKRGASLYGAPWDRDLAIDLDAIAAWGAQAVLTLIEDPELLELGVTQLGEQVKVRGMEWHHLPIPDLHAPTESFEVAWRQVGPTVLRLLRDGGRVVVHCRGGIGRAGTIAALLLMELGAPADEALQRVRQARPGAVETAAQERYLAAYTATHKR